MFLIFSFLQTTFLSMNLVLLLVVALALWEEKNHDWLLFVAGAFFDLINNLPLGLSCLVFILLTRIISSARSTWFFLGVFCLALVSACLITSFFATGSWQGRSSLITLGLGIGLLVVFKILGLESEEEQTKIKV